MNGISVAAKQIQSLGRSPDTMLAHISPDEAKLVDYLQGGTKRNPQTGLPEYGLFGDILKGIVRAAGAVVGFTIGGPAGAAAGAGLTTKLTGGSWKDALTSAALSGVGGELGQGLGGGGWSLTGAGNSAVTGLSGLSGSAGWSVGGASGAAGVAPGSAAAAALAPAASVGASSALGNISAAALSAGGLGAAVPAAFSKNASPQVAPSVSGLPQQNINLNVEPANRQYQPYQGDYSKYGEVGGGMGHLFFNPVLPKPKIITQQPTQDQSALESQFLARGGAVKRFIAGGAVAADPNDGLEHNQDGSIAGLRSPGTFPSAQPIPTNQLPGGGFGSWGAPGPLGGRGMGPHMPGGPGVAGPRALMGPGLPGAGAGQPDPRQSQILKATMFGYSLGKGFARGGQVQGIGMAAAAPRMVGPVMGPGDGKADEVPAMLSDGEHVFDADVTARAGNGSNDAGHHVLENIKQEIRKQSAQPNTRQPSKKINTSPHMVSAMVKRAKRKAGVTMIAPRMA